jgi:hypothetical protein
MKRTIFLALIIPLVLVGCGGGGSSNSGSNIINSADYKLPTAVPSVPDQAGK